MPTYLRPLLALATACALAAAAGAEERDLVLVDWDEANWALRPDMSLEHDVGKTPNGEPLARITLHSPGENQDLFTARNLPVTARTLSMFIKATAKGAGRHEAVFQDANGWSGNGVTLWGITGDTTYQTSALDHGWGWRFGFFHGQSAAPFRFIGWRFHGRDPAKPGEAFTPCLVEVGPVHVSYEPNDAEWLWCDLQPKTVPTKLATGGQPALTLRVGNLGTSDRTFALVAQPIERAQRPLAVRPVALGNLTLKAGEVKTVPVKLPLALLGRYEIEYRATVTGMKDPATRREPIAVVNADDQADGFRAYVAKRKWCEKPERRAVVGADGKPAPTLGSADNGLANVPLYPVLPRVAHGFTRVDAALAAKRASADKDGKPVTPYGEHVLMSQFSPAWLVTTDQPSLALFDELREHGEGSPTHLAFMTRDGARVIANGDAVAAADLGRMSEPWLLAWWDGAAGWSRFDAPFLVCLQRKPTALTFDAHGVALTFAGPAGASAVMPLYGYAKLPQRAWAAEHAGDVKLPAEWPVADLQSWTWAKALPTSVAQRCSWWSRALLRFPYQVKESYVVDHAAGAVKVHDEFSYLELENDWKTPALAVAPLSPTIALARRSGFPSTVGGKLVDATYATMFGPYQVVEGRTIDWTMDVGPYLFQAADLDPRMPPDGSTVARQAQGSLYGRAFAAENDNESHLWNFHDGNFVWWAQTDFRLTGLAAPMLPRPWRDDLKSWYQAQALATVLDQGRYGQDERNAMFRRYIDGPGIGNWGVGDWGDSGKLGQDMLYDLYAYAYGTGDWQTIADHWDTIASLDSMPVTMSWCAIGRGAIAEEGDEAPTMLALARMAYAVGDKPMYGAAAYWFGRELVHHSIKEGAFKAWQAQLTPWNPDWDAHTNPSNLWGTNAAWVGHGPFAKHDVGEWVNRVTRLDDVDTLRFIRDHATGLAKEEVAFDDSQPDAKRDEATGMVLLFERIAFLGLDPQKAIERHATTTAKPTPDRWLIHRAEAWTEFPPKLETLIPASEPAVSDDGWAWQQMNNVGYGLINPVSLAPGRMPTPQWFWWSSPHRAPGEWGEKWSFGAISPSRDQLPEAVDGQDVGWGAQVFHIASRQRRALDRLSGPVHDLAANAGLSDAELAPIVEAWDEQQSIPALVCGPFSNPGGGAQVKIAHAPEAAYVGGKVDTKQRFADTGPEGKPLGDATIGWTATSIDGTYLDFNRWWSDRNDVAAYVTFAVQAPTELKAQFAVGSDDGIVVWLNGTRVHENATTRGSGMDQDHAAVSLNAGWNTVLIKVTQGNGGWALNFRIADQRGLPIPGLAFAPQPH